MCEENLDEILDEELDENQDETLEEKQLKLLGVKATALGGEPISKDVLSMYLEDAKHIILSTRFPCEVELPEEIEPRYLNLQIRIALELISKLGAEGQISHSENGVSRGYENASISHSLLSEITPYVGVI